MKTRPLPPVLLSLILAVPACKPPDENPPDSGSDVGPDMPVDGGDVGDAGPVFGPNVIPPYAATVIDPADHLDDPTGDQFRWSISDEPEAFAARMLDADSRTPTLIPQVPGRYELAVEITRGGETQTSLVALTARAHECPEPTVVDSRPDGDTTWSNVVEAPGCADYVVSGDLYFSSTSLTIDPSVVVEFDQGSLSFAADGTLDAAGTVREPVALVSGDAEAGTWTGVRMQDTTGGRLEHVIVLGGGAGSPEEAANLHLENTEGLEIVDAFVTRSSGHGVRLVGPRADLDAFTDSFVTGNAAAPIATETDLAHLVGDTNFLQENGNDWIAMRAETIGANATWSHTGVPYRVVKPVPEGATFQVDADLKIDPGVRVTFEERMGMMVGGLLEAVGSEEEPVVFTGTDAEPGHWRGIAVFEGEATFDQAVVEYGGSDRFPVLEDRANLLVLQNGETADVTVRNTTLRHSAAHGLVQRLGTTLTFDANTVTGNAGAAAVVPAEGVGALGPDSTYDGNGDDVVYIDPARFAGGEWQDLGVDYVVREATNPVALCITGALKIERGVTLRFAPDTGMEVCAGGGLEAVGTAMEPIEFLADTESWRGILIQEATAEFDHIVVEDAGSTAYLDGAPAGVTLMENSADPDVTANADFGDVSSGSGQRFGIAFGAGNTFAPSSPGCFGMGPIFREEELPRPKCSN